MDHVPLRTFSLCENYFLLLDHVIAMRVMATSGRFSRRSGQIVAELYRTKVYVAVVTLRFRDDEDLAFGNHVVERHIDLSLPGQAQDRDSISWLRRSNVVASPTLPPTSYGSANAPATSVTILMSAFRSPAQPRAHRDRNTAW